MKADVKFWNFEIRKSLIKEFYFHENIRVSVWHIHRNKFTLNIVIRNIEYFIRNYQCIVYFFQQFDFYFMIDLSWQQKRVPALTKKVPNFKVS